jgi:hypothetical protein
VGKEFKCKGYVYIFCGKNSFLPQKSRVYMLGKKPLRQLFVDEKNKARENDVGNYTIRIFVICFLLLIVCL